MCLLVPLGRHYRPPLADIDTVDTHTLIWHEDFALEKCTIFYDNSSIQIQKKIRRCHTSREDRLSRDMLTAGLLWPGRGSSPAWTYTGRRIRSLGRRRRLFSVTKARADTRKKKQNTTWLL